MESTAVDLLLGATRESLQNLTIAQLKYTLPDAGAYGTLSSKVDARVLRTFAQFGM